MGYRTYIGSMPKKEWNKIKSMTKEQLMAFYPMDDDESYWYKGVYDFGKQLYEFGKDADFQPPKKSIKTFFKKKDVHSHYNNYNELFVVTKEFLAYIIETYRSKVSNIYKDMLKPFHDDSSFLDTVEIKYGYPQNNYKYDFSKITQSQQNALHEMFSHIGDFRMEWVLLTPYDLTNGEECTNSWKYEYGIFELIRIYKSFDWNKNIMFYYGF
jgi:hypothetical protein